MRQGDPEKAKLWIEWNEDRNVKKAIGIFGEAVHAFGANDKEGFLDGIANLYNATGYYDDGISVDRGRSTFDYADNGDIIGAKIAFIDNATGKEFITNVEGVSDLYAIGLGMLAPEKAFEAGYAMTLGAKKVQPKSIDPAKLMEAIEARKLSDPEFAKLTSDEQEAIMVNAFQRIASGSLGVGVGGDGGTPVDPHD
jgi:hypothetical protein